MLTIILRLVASLALLGMILKIASLFRSESPRLRWIFGLGLAGRAVAAQVLFWISYLNLPVARSLQLGDGLWFFAIDSQVYGALAHTALQGGWREVIFINQTMASPFYVQLLAIATFLTGEPVIAGIIINLLAYSLSALIIARVGRYLSLELPASVAMAALAFSPSGVLWSLQPLKDTVFVALILLFAYVSLQWQRGWRSGTRRPWLVVVAATAAMYAVTFAVAGIRWYFAVFALAASSLMFLIVAVQQRGRRILYALAAGALSIILLSHAIVSAAEPYLPAPFRRILAHEEAAPVAEAATEPATAAEIGTYVENTRQGFERSGGATAVKPGKVIAAAEPAAPAPVAEPGNRPAAEPAAKPEPAPPLGEDAAAREATPPADLERTRIQRMTTGAVAMLIPQSIAERLGLIDIGGGRGLILFTDFDTLVFDALLIFVLINTARLARRGGWRNAVLWQQLLLVLLIGAALAYTVSNFGTLFRHRAMVYAGLLLLPLLAASANGTNSVAVPSADGGNGGRTSEVSAH